MPTLPSGLPEIIDPTEDIARFLCQNRHFRQDSVRHEAFLPNPKDRETSVSRHGREPSTDLWELGRTACGERTLYGAAIVKALSVTRLSLELIAQEGPPHHAVIKGWPWNDLDPVEQKSIQKELALRLATEAGRPVLIR